MKPTAYDAGAQPWDDEEPASDGGVRSAALQSLALVGAAIAAAAAAALGARHIPWQSGFLIVLALAGVAVAVWARLQLLLDNGILPLLPAHAQRQLTRTNLLTWIRDDSLSRRVAPFLPLLLPMTPAETRAFLDAAPPAFRHQVLAPGLAHLLPATIQRLLMGRRQPLPALGGHLALPAPVAASLGMGTPSQRSQRGSARSPPVAVAEEIRCLLYTSPSPRD